MSRVPSWVWISGIVVVAIAGGVGYGLWSSQATSPAVEIPVAVAPEPEPAPAPAALPPVPTPAPVVAKTNIQAPPAVETADASTEAPTWQSKLDDVLLSDKDENQKADTLLAMLPGLKEADQVEISQHLVNFATDENYAGIAQILTNPATAEGVSSVFMTDLLNRNDALKLPLLLAIAREENHPKHDEAHNLLELFLQDNYGNDWTKWDESIQTWLKDNGTTLASEKAALAAPEAPENNPTNAP